MYTLVRTTAHPATPIRILVSQPEGNDAGLDLGGAFFFQPAGGEAAAAGENRATVSEYAARLILADPAYGPHFTCEPPLPAPPAPAVEAEAAEPSVVDAAAPEAPARRARRSE